MKVELMRKIDTDGIWFIGYVNDWPVFSKQDEHEAWEEYAKTKEMISSGKYRAVTVMASEEVDAVEIKST